MESTDDVEHFLLEGIHVCFLCAVKLGAVKYAFAAAAGRTCITAGVAADAFAKLLLEKREALFRAHFLDLLNFRETVCILCILGFADDLIVDHVLFSLAYMAALQHCILVGYGLVTIDCRNMKLLTGICKLCSGNTFDSLDSHFAKLLHIQLSFTANTNNIGLFTIHTMFLDQLVKAVGITRLQTDKSFSL